MQNQREQGTWEEVWEHRSKESRELGKRCVNTEAKRVGNLERDVRTQKQRGQAMDRDV